VHLSQAIRFQNFLTSVVPVKSKVTKKLVSADNHSNTFNIKFTYFMDMCTLCKDDLAVLPASLAKQLGDLCPLVLVERVTSLVRAKLPFSRVSYSSVFIFLSRQCSTLPTCMCLGLFDKNRITDEDFNFHLNSLVREERHLLLIFVYACITSYHIRCTWWTR
jgi:hypothetical protein